jgi:hypothetical protein
MATPSAYQRVGNVAITPSDYDTVGFPFYLRFDGDDWLQTNTITPGTDKVAVFAGVRKLSDAAFGMILEHSTSDSNSGMFYLGNTATGRFQFLSKGTIARSADDVVAAPVTRVFTGLSDISGDSILVRANGTQVATNTGDQGTGNFLAYPLYIGRRGGTTLPLNGHIHQLIARFGPNLDAATIANAEKFVGTKTGITL